MPTYEAKRELNKLTRKRRFLSMRLAGRRIVDLLRFGKGPVERIGSACVLSAVFFFAPAVGAFVIGMPPMQGVAIALIAFAVAALTLLAFIIGPPDDEIRSETETLGDEIDEVRAEIQKAEDEEERERQRERDEEDEEEERRRRRPVKCPYCLEKIDRQAVKCSRCGEWVDEDYRPRERTPRRGVSPGIAALLSFFFVGAGQIAQSRVGAGLLWMFSTIVCYVSGPWTCCVSLFIGVLLHVLCIIDAAAYDE